MWIFVWIFHNLKRSIIVSFAWSFIYSRSFLKQIFSTLHKQGDSKEGDEKQKTKFWIGAILITLMIVGGVPSLGYPILGLITVAFASWGALFKTFPWGLAPLSLGLTMFIGVITYVWILYFLCLSPIIALLNKSKSPLKTYNYHAYKEISGLKKVFSLLVTVFTLFSDLKAPEQAGTIIAIIMWNFFTSE